MSFKRLTLEKWLQSKSYKDLDTLLKGADYHGDRHSFMEDLQLYGILPFTNLLSADAQLYICQMYCAVMK